MMRLSYDPHVNAAYIRLKEGRFEVTTHRLTEDVAVNYAPDGSVVGMEPHGHSPWYLFVHPWGGILSEPTARGRGASRRIEVLDASKYLLHHRRPEVILENIHPVV